MAYGNLTIGSRGDEVKKLQQYLIDAGYDIGSYGLDGVYGNDTANAVKKYQQDNGLTVDGIAGNNTLSKLYSTQSNTQTTKPTTPTDSGKDQPQYSMYDPNTNQAYLDALEALKKAQENMPEYIGKYDEQLQEIYDKIVNRKDFTYDLNSDALYQQYKDQYSQMGQMAMMDTIGQASAMTGGYGSSYAQGVGQQTYQGYLQQLNDRVPELYGIALDQYNQEGQDLLNQYSMLGDLAGDEYAKYQDALNQYWQQLNYQKQLADQEYERGFKEWQAEYGVQQDEYNKQQDEYQKQQDAYNKLVSLITTTGYNPSAEDLEKAGMSQSEADAYLNYYTKANTPTSAYRYSSDSGEGEEDEGGDDSVRKLQEQLSKLGFYSGEINGVRDDATQKAIKEYYKWRNQNKVTYDDVARNAAALRAKGASSEDIRAYIVSATSGMNYWVEGGRTAAQDKDELIGAYVGRGR